MVTGSVAYRGFSRVLRGQAFRSGAAVAVLGVVTCLPVYLVIYRLQAHGQSAAAVAMGSMHMDRMGVFWAFPLLQAAGIGALIWAYLGIVLGLVVSGRPPGWWRLSRPRTDRLHRQVSLLVIALILVHALATAEDAMGDSLRTAFLPWQESWTAAVFAYNVGIFALYLAVLVGPTYYLRRRIGTRWWMLAHRLALAVYILSVWHTLLLGADFSYYPWLRAVTWLAQIPLLGLLAWRLLKSRRRGPTGPGTRRYWAAPARYWLAAVSAAGIAAVAVLVGTGHADLPARVGSAARSGAGGADWMPGWLGITLAVLLALAALVRARHLADGPRRRIWHGAHVLMAAGMIDMLLPLRAMPVPAAPAETAFAVAALAAAAIAAASWPVDRAAAVLALVTSADLAVMAYMFAVPAGGAAWLTWLLCAWLTLETAYWASGRLGTLARRTSPVRPTGRPRHGLPDPGRSDLALTVPAITGPGLASQEAAARAAATADDTADAATGTLLSQPEQVNAVRREPLAGPHYHAELAVPLILMCLCMAYMLLAAHYGAGGPAGAPGMEGMPGM